MKKITLIIFSLFFAAKSVFLTACREGCKEYCTDERQACVGGCGIITAVPLTINSGILCDSISKGSSCSDACCTSFFPRNCTPTADNGGCALWFFDSWALTTCVWTLYHALPDNCINKAKEKIKNCGERRNACVASMKERCSRNKCRTACAEDCGNYCTEERSACLISSGVPCFLSTLWNYMCCMNNIASNSCPEACQRSFFPGSCSVNDCDLNTCTCCNWVSTSCTLVSGAACIYFALESEGCHDKIGETFKKAVALKCCKRNCCEKKPKIILQEPLQPEFLKQPEWVQYPTTFTTITIPDHITMGDDDNSENNPLLVYKWGHEPINN